MKFPEEQEITVSTGKLDREYCIGWNACLSACRKMNEQEPRLLALDITKLRNLLDSQLAPQSMFELKEFMDRFLHDVCSKFGRPEISEKDILDSLDGVPSSHFPICKIEGKVYYYMCKEEIAKLISAKLLEGRK